MRISKIPRNGEVRNEIPAALTDDMTISAEAVRLWIKLYNSNRSKNKSYVKFQPTTQALATLFGVKKITIKRWMKELKDNGWIDTIGDNNDTTIIVYYTPRLVSKKIPPLVSKKIPITIKDAFATQVGEKASTTITKNFEENELDYGINFPD
jgi:DNA-binding transcriptional regulator YhcF (GntR family)